ncbi:hypothetical protein CAEBREN_05318 [Caenorhabditis brenneri]|uniref:RRM domain-containing protein n=1 Tax=Caenorhabditis brenneri TaxID=135651 RepID=G0ML90_CAEBE|nr:hypothetical protein CAEBREN_05318 [Caenorhabditis brenneri]
MAPIVVDAPLSVAIKRNKTKKILKRSSKKQSPKPNKSFSRRTGKPNTSRPVREFWSAQRRPSSSNENRLVRINLSNLAPTVTREDLRELFNEYSIKNVSVNFDANRDPIGTGDVTLFKSEADRLIHNLSGVAIDNQEIKFNLIDKENILSRVSLPNGKKTVLIKKKPARADQIAEGKKVNKEQKVKMTIEELDAELDAYMNNV